MHLVAALKLLQTISKKFVDFLKKNSLSKSVATLKVFVIMVHLMHSSELFNC